MKFDPLVEAYIIGEQLSGNTITFNENSRYPRYSISVSDNSIIPTEHFILYPDSIRFLIFSRYELHAHIIFSMYHTKSFSYSEISKEFRIEESGEKLYNILVGFEQSLNKIKENFDEDNIMKINKEMEGG